MPPPLRDPELPAALVFDLDGTIVDTETPEFEAIRAVWAGHGLEYSVTQFEKVIGTVSGSAWLDELDAAVAQTNGNGPIDRSTARAVHGTVHRKLTDALRSRNGIVALIDDAIAAGVPMAVASNSPRWWVQARIEAAGLAHALFVLVTLGDSSAPKPDPAPFLSACAMLGADPRQSVAFEDSATGVQSARAAGLYTIACAGPLTIGHDLSAAHRIVTSHTEISLAKLGPALRTDRVR